MPYIVNLANKGFKKAILEDAGFRQGVTTYQGFITNPAVAASLHRDYTSLDL
ncbi:hypothetical protein [Bacteroides acidifaciens]|uniref:hypothetical protein n=1 Tax=Bacteroides acidifaciens TaxID=85831 RepID=UPI00374D46F3